MFICFLSYLNRISSDSYKALCDVFLHCCFETIVVFSTSITKKGKISCLSVSVENSKVVQILKEIFEFIPSVCERRDLSSTYCNHSFRTFLLFFISLILRTIPRKRNDILDNTNYHLPLLLLAKLWDLDECTICLHC